MRTPVYFPARGDLAGTATEGRSLHERVLDLGRRRPYWFPVGLATACALATWLTSVDQDLPIRDPDGIGGPPLFRLSAILAVFMALDVLPRAARRGWPSPRGMASALRAVVRERYTPRRTALVLVGLFAFYITYVSYRNFKGFLPFLRPEIQDAGLLAFERGLFGEHPANLLHAVLGTGFANEFLSVAYVIYLGFVPMSLAAALVWFGTDMRQGLWYATALCLNWVLGAISYYAVPSMGPVFVAPELFSDLGPTASSALQHSLWVERLTVLWGDAGAGAPDVVQSIAGFASLHVSVVLTAALVATLVRARRWLLWLLWAYVAVTMVGTIYLGWHYVIDDIGGIVIAVAAVWIGAVATGHDLTGWRPGRRVGTDGPPAGSSAAVCAPAASAPAPASTVAAPAPGSQTLNLPNVLSFTRILIAPVVALLVLAHPDGSMWAAALFAAGGLTDVLDGHLARSRGLVTRVGKLLDPAADKLLVVAALASLVAVDRLALWIVGVIAAREILVTGLRAHAARQGVVIAAGSAGKAKMFLQVAMVLALMAVPDPGVLWVEALVAATVALTVASGAGYLRGYLRGRRLAAAPAGGAAAGTQATAVASDGEHVAEPPQLVA